MEIRYAPKMAKKLVDDKAIKKNYCQLYKRIKLALSLLHVASNLGEVPNLPPTRRHKLTGEYKNCWGLDLSVNYRMIISPSDGGEDPHEIKIITIQDIVDYH